MHSALTTIEQVQTLIAQPAGMEIEDVMEILGSTGKKVAGDILTHGYHRWELPGKGHVDCMFRSGRECAWIKVYPSKAEEK